ncbi:MAG: hypothetical protein AAFN93_21495, partial [Bacteroidota bacterium]
NYQNYRSRRIENLKDFEQYTEYKRKEWYKNAAKELRDEIKNNRISKEMEFFTDMETGECFYYEYVELAKLYYCLKSYNKAVYAIFQKGNEYSQQIVSSMSSRHRLDEVWNWQKSALIRKLWKNFLTKSKVHESFNPMHLMLTVPHNQYGWNDREFYAKEFIEKFNFMRKSEQWRKYIYGGEYGIEVTRKGNNGLHIHMHCLVFQDPKYSVNEVRDYIQYHWNKLTKAKITHYETLYIYDRKANNQLVSDSEGKPVKKYLSNDYEWFRGLNEDEKISNYLLGVMECIKYHFKSDNFKDQDGEWDIDLIKDVLNNSRNLRFYSKFGAFYNEKSLNYSRLETSEDTELIEENADYADLLEDGEEVPKIAVKPSLDGVSGSKINPFTMEMCQPGEYTRVLATPEMMYHDKDSDFKPLVNQNNHHKFYELRNDKTLRDILRCSAKGDYGEIMKIEDYERFMHHVQGESQRALI